MKTISTFVAAVAFGLAMSASASEGARTEAVALSDLNLTSEKGYAIAETRVRQAAEEVCGSDDFRLVGVRQASKNLNCQRDAIASAMAGVEAQRSNQLASK